MKHLIAVIAVSGSVMATTSLANALAPYGHGIKPGSVVFAQGDCKLGYEWNEKKQRCTKAERDY